MPTRRHLLASLSSLTLAACGGGGGSPPPPPAPSPSLRLSSDRSQYFVGEQAELRVEFSGSGARLEPGFGRVQSGQVLRTRALAGPLQLRLEVDAAPGQTPQRAELNLDVRYRDRFSPVGDFSASSHSALPLADGRVLVLGGSRGGVVLSDGIDRFDPVQRRFERIGSLSSGRSEATAVQLPDGRVLLAGGITALPVANRTELIDPSTGQVQTSGNLAQTRHGHSLTLLADGRVLIAGGTARASAELWDPQSGRWSFTASPMQHDRSGHSATLLSDGRVLIAGGHRIGEGPYVFAELFDPASGRFTPLPEQGLAPRAAHSAWRAPDGRVLLLAGERTRGDGLDVLADALRFDPQTLRFEPLSGLGQARTLAQAAPLGDGRWLLLGGQTAAERALRRNEAWAPGLAAQARAELPEPRVLHSLTPLPDGRLLVLGGEGLQGQLVPTALLYE